MPAALTAEELSTLIESALADSGASGMKDMGKVVALLKPQLLGRADMAAVTAQIKAKLA